jgi:integrase
MIATNRIKPAKPRPDFPLFPHATGRWAKKIRGRLHYFGPWSDPDGALAKYLAEKDALIAGRKPRSTEDTEALTVFVLGNKFLNTKKARVESGELSERTWAEYREVCRLLVKSFGKYRLVEDLYPDDFAKLRKTMTRRWGPHRLGKFIQCVRCVFRYGGPAPYGTGLFDRPVNFGPDFRRPSKKTMRQHRAAQGPRMFEADEIRGMLAAASTPMRAMILLGVNCGFGNADCGRLPIRALDLEGGWANYPRQKTGIERRCPLWPETTEAIKQALAERPQPKVEEDAGLVFITSAGLSWHKAIADSPITKEMRKLLDSLKINGHRNFYALRHTFETIAGESRDQVAVDAIMGHARDDMASVYRERISDERLRAAAEFVRRWLYEI